jgi:hypothetical protein
MYIWVSKKNHVNHWLRWIRSNINGRVHFIHVKTYGNYCIKLAEHW